MSASEKDLPVKSIPPRKRIGLRFLLQNRFHPIVCGIAYLSNLTQLFYTLTLYTSSSQSHGALWNAFLQWLTTKAINERARYIFLGLFWTDQKILMSYLVSILIYVITLVFTGFISSNWKNKISTNGFISCTILWLLNSWDMMPLLLRLFS